MRIVVDAMGSDDRPGPDVEGAVLAAKEWGDPIILVGPEAQIKAELAKHNTEGLKIEVVNASEVIEMTDKPSESAKRKTNSSMHVGMGLVRDGQADAFVSAGNTGAILAVAILNMKRIRGVKRPTLTLAIPNMAGQVILSDVGANADVKPEWLVQFGMMASLYAKNALGIANPRVALLSNGEEEGKGNELIHETIPLMRAQSQFNFIGNVEPKEVLRGEADIVIHDGFSGNIMMKTLEATASMVGRSLEQAIRSGVITSIGGLLARPAFRSVRKRLDPHEIGGAILLGVDGVVIIGHGSSNARSIRSAILQARQAVKGKLIDAIKAGLEGESEA